MTGGVIEWTGKRRWNPLRGCTRKTEACRHCYAEGMAARFSDIGMPFEGFANWVTKANGKREARWTGKVELVEERLTLPLRWKTPALCFTDTQSDFFHESLPDEILDRRMAVMIQSPHIHFQVLTKRWERMRDYMAHHRWHIWAGLARELRAQFPKLREPEIWGGDRCPIPNVSFGVSVHDQTSANQAIPALLDTPAAIRFASFEPALGLVDWKRMMLNAYRHIDGLTGGEYLRNGNVQHLGRTYSKLDLIIAGEESGHGRRDVDLDVFRQTRDQCAASGTHFFLKQRHINGKLVSCPELDGRQHTDLPEAWRSLL